MRLAGIFFLVAEGKNHASELISREQLCFDYISQVTLAQYNEYTDFPLYG